MRLILTWILSFGLLFGLMIALARQIGLSQPPPLLLQHLHLTQCSPPCWIGILPGQTTGQEVVARLRSAFGLPETHIPLARLNTAVTIATTIPLPDFDTSLYRMLLEIQLLNDFVIPPERTITGIRWWFPDAPSALPNLTLGDVVNTFGIPTCVYIGTPSQGWYFIWDVPEGITEVVVLTENRVSWRQPIYTMNFRQHTRGYGQDACHTDSPNYLAWRGLVSRIHYQRQNP